ncbi:MAG: hypothetical protein C4524_08695 [Candidatus Zixiibacteriota bacterium]|nr:MAG: hypothetical protein C4524_08695 [candidate division Zixibacteria bacterium]
MRRFLLLSLALALLAGCGKRTPQFNPGDYVSYQPGNMYVYTGMMGYAEVKSRLPIEGGTQFVVVDKDSAGREIARETYVQKDGRLYWQTFDGTGQGMLSYTFDPPLPASPFSGTPGEKAFQEGVEIRSDSAGTRLRYRVDMEILPPEDVAAPAGEFPACARMKAVITYLDPTNAPFINGEAEWWYAPGVGVVKYRAAGTEGMLEQASINGRSYEPPGGKWENFGQASAPQEEGDGKH